MLKPNGVALLDVGPTLPGPALHAIMTDDGFSYLAHRRSWFGDATGEMVFRYDRPRTKVRGESARVSDRVIVPQANGVDGAVAAKAGHVRSKVHGRQDASA